MLLQPQERLIQGAGLPPHARILVDATHLGRHVTGIERITQELFSARALAPLPVTQLSRPFGGALGMMAGQQLMLPAQLRRERAGLLICSGFPPPFAVSLFSPERVVAYVHDLFLITRPQDLSWKARLYMAPAFRLMLKQVRHFLVNSETTARQLRQFARTDADIRLYRPAVPNVFGLRANGAAHSPTRKELRLVSIGTLEPRKNYEAAARIVSALRAQGLEVTLDIIGREGWGGVAKALRGAPGVRLRGYLTQQQAKAIIEKADMYLCTSADEGLGLPLLEVQHAGLPVIAPDLPVFREVLGSSGIFIDPQHTQQAADIIAQARWRAAALRALALANLRRWNAQAARDRLAVIDWLAARLQQLAARHR